MSTIEKMEELTSVPWHDAKDFSWCNELENSTELIKSELEQVLKEGTGRPYLGEFNDTTKRPANASQGWHAYFLKRHSEWQQPNIDICKETRRLLEYCSAGPSEALFSCLGPASSTPIHEGPTNTVLTCHLPLIVPSNCAIRVASETRSWKQDEVMVFDDTYLHAAWNNSTKPRYVLLFEIWHPELTEIERKAMKIIFTHTLFTE